MITSLRRKVWIAMNGSWKLLPQNNATSLHERPGQRQDGWLTSYGFDIWLLYAHVSFVEKPQLWAVEMFLSIVQLPVNGTGAGGSLGTRNYRWCWFQEHWEQNVNCCLHAKKVTMSESYDFTEEEIRRKLEELGYSHIPADKLKQFQRGLLQVLVYWRYSVSLLNYGDINLHVLIESFNLESLYVKNTIKLNLFSVFLKITTSIRYFEVHKCLICAEIVHLHVRS